MLELERRLWQRAIDETTLLIIGEEPCGDCGQHHELIPAGAASCRRARIVREAALDTSRAIDERLRRGAQKPRARRRAKS